MRMDLTAQLLGEATLQIARNGTAAGELPETVRALVPFDGAHQAVPALRDTRAARIPGQVLSRNLCAR